MSDRVCGGREGKPVRMCDEAGEKTRRRVGERADKLMKTALDPSSERSRLKKATSNANLVPRVRLWIEQVSI